MAMGTIMRTLVSYKTKRDHWVATCCRLEPSLSVGLPHFIITVRAESHHLPPFFALLTASFHHVTTQKKLSVSKFISSTCKLSERSLCVLFFIDEIIIFMLVDHESLGANCGANC